MIMLNKEKLLVRAKEILVAGGCAYPPWKLTKALAEALGASFQAGQADGAQFRSSLLEPPAKRRGKKSQTEAETP